MKMVAYRIGYVLITLLFGVVLYRTEKVRHYDRLIFGWLFLTIVFLLLFNFTRPLNYLTTSFDVIVPFAIYVLSPLRIHQTISLALSFSVGTLYVAHFFKSGVDPITLQVATSAQFVVQILGWLSALQIQTYRRKSFQAFIDEKDAKEMVAYLANIDPLTTSLTRRHFFNIAEAEFLRFKRYKRAMAVMVIDVDNFKRVNDTYGHHAGDLALRSLSLVAMDHKRAPDTFGRLGGEEFGLLLPETNLQQATIVAERIRSMWEQSPVNLDGEPIHSTVSIGVAGASPADTAFEDLLRRADQMMYKAKNSGRNRVVTE
jgi:diguanylate cyclase (GGDEF)-like protein